MKNRPEAIKEIRWAPSALNELLVKKITKSRAQATTLSSLLYRNRAIGASYSTVFEYLNRQEVRSTPRDEGCIRYWLRIGHVTTPPVILAE